MYHSNYYAAKVEIYPLSKDERKYLFASILCNPDHVNSTQISVGQVKCFAVHFRDINRANGSIAPKKQIKVLNFDQIEGKDALWDISIKAANERVKAISQELLVDCYLQLDGEAEEKQQVMNQFIDKSMTCL